MYIFIIKTRFMFVCLKSVARSYIYIFVVVFGRSDLDRLGRVMKFSTGSISGVYHI